MAASFLKSLFALFLLAVVPADSYQQARLSLLGRDYKAAIEQLQQSLRELGDDAKPQVVDRLRFLLANSQLLAGQRAEAEA
jgi:hypothetical protein